MTARHTVLVVDDEPFVRQSLQDMLEGEGLRVVAAADLKAAHKLLQSEPVDAVVTDLQMPQGGGMALLDEVDAQGSGLPVIVMRPCPSMARAALSSRLSSTCSRRPASPFTSSGWSSPTRSTVTCLKCLP